MVSPQGAESEEPDTIDMGNERPHTAQLKGETEETLKEPMPGQPDEGVYGEQSYTPVMELLERHDSDGEL